jgi:hypothetical protein
MRPDVLGRLINVSSPWQFEVAIALGWCVFLLAVAAIPLAARGSSRVSWRLYVSAIIGLAVVETSFTSALFAEFVPWWRVAAIYLATQVAPILGASAFARVAVARWPRRPWIVAIAAASIALVSLGALGKFATRDLAFDVLSASS